MKEFFELKKFILSPPVLDYTRPGEALYLYLVISDMASSFVLFREKKGIQKPIFLCK